MYCPKCGSAQVDYSVKFCVKCGFLLNNVVQIIENNGNLPQFYTAPKSKNGSQRSRGIKQGAFVMLLTLLIVPLIAILSTELDLSPTLVALTAVILFIGGLLRIIYAFMFQDSTPVYDSQNENRNPVSFGSVKTQNALPPQNEMFTPANVYANSQTPNWRDTSELVTPTSVTENTTKFLEMDDKK
ncbi:MAG: hypothetical protein H7Z37_13925 [Pyrinomonadaceae bacterium]|nr:hypothetical protein [Pyrinomonadaceae bacterium]